MSARADRLAVLALAVACGSAAAAIGAHLVIRRDQRRMAAHLLTMSRLQQAHDASSEQYLTEARERLHKKRMAERGDARFLDLMRTLVERISEVRQDDAMQAIRDVEAAAARGAVS